jgi:hypothetical protein
VAEPAAAWVTALPALPALVLLLLGLWGVRRHLKAPRTLWIILVIALLVRLIWMPVGLHLFDGHEAEYRDIFLGDRALSRGSAMLYPAMQWFYAGLGLLTHNTHALLAVSCVASLVSIAATYGIGRRIAGESVGLTGAALLALWGNHAFWATSAYNVALPMALALTAIWGLLLLVQEEEGVAAALAGGAAALAVATRIECVLLAPLGLALLLWARPRLSRRSLGLLGLGAALGLWALWAILSAGPLPGGEERVIALQNNLFHFGFWAPFGGVAALCLLPALWISWTKRRAVTLILVGFLLLFHVVIASFNDVGFRHTLFGGWVLALLLGSLVEEKWAWPVLVLAVGAVLAHSADVADRYYMSEERFAQRLAEAPVFPSEKLSECVLICEDARVLPEGQQRSHFNLLMPSEREAIFAEKGCIYWLFGVQDARWSSRAVRDRALRLEHMFEMVDRGRLARENGYVGSVMEIAPQR